MAKTSPIKFVQQIRAEAKKVTWPSRRETTVTTIMCVIFVFFAAVFFLIADQILSWLVGLVLGTGN
ncbi:MAG: preprotein translocase subunit SecE [Rhodobiaceae bacterium]|jgi:preprotein translocase subunit SecE|nr:preprotein translocase subunit SecE [Rhodobiaceae bacterium]MBT5640096.1 preprotein translocase subunit SecE [Rhodobiaceae bacterium]MBT6223786.1 preprotein translocase subunit SecE [Rhodobiaceae bacterium]MDB4831304.1 preprotein translocase subunit SecE [Hyphomicrobiales bacterium]MDC3272567.1 preprotein translocase subunit SecE [Hyphomicrobiales bacterium]|tara:strand:- start:3787 stop:3984 length:198 start_codon:yes stop_codon:yes gene_type:complete